MPIEYEVHMPFSSLIHSVVAATLEPSIKYGARRGSDRCGRLERAPKPLQPQAACNRQQNTWLVQE